MMRYTPPAAPTAASPAVQPEPPTTYVWSGPRRGLRHHVAHIALSVLAVLGVACVLLAVTHAALGIRPLVVRSGSMAPALPIGSLTLVRAVPALEIDPGDVVSAVRRDGTRVTHRVVTVEDDGALRRLTTQGDANEAPDAEPITATEVERVVATLPWLGRALTSLGSGPVLLVIGGLVATALRWGFGPPTLQYVGRWVPERRTSGGAS